ncbi:hypothetical protein PFISCL1PPCAC_202, partial [Pristionchus fissidentatus]
LQMSAMDDAPLPELKYVSGFEPQFLRVYLLIITSFLYVPIEVGVITYNYRYMCRVIHEKLLFTSSDMQSTVKLIRVDMLIHAFVYSFSLLIARQPILLTASLVIDLDNLWCWLVTGFGDEKKIYGYFLRKYRLCFCYAWVIAVFISHVDIIISLYDKEPYKHVNLPWPI